MLVIHRRIYRGRKARRPLYAPGSGHCSPRYVCIQYASTHSPTCTLMLRTGAGMPWIRSHPPRRVSLFILRIRKCVDQVRCAFLSLQRWENLNSDNNNLFHVEIPRFRTELCQKDEKRKIGSKSTVFNNREKRSVVYQNGTTVH